MARRRGLIQTARGPKRLTNWGLGPGGAASTSFSSSSASIIGSGVTFGAAGTIVRLRGLVAGLLTSSTSAGDGFFGAFGVGIASSAAFAAGIASLPTPVTEAGWDGWMYHTWLQAHEGSPDGPGDAGAFRVEVDSKVMRRVSEDMTLYAAAEFTEGGTAAMLLFFDSRLLVKEG